MVDAVDPHLSNDSSIELHVDVFAYGVPLCFCAYLFFSFFELCRHFFKLLLALIGAHLPAIVQHLDSKDGQQQGTNVESEPARNDDCGIAKADRQEGHEA